VETAESLAIVEIHPTVRNVQDVQRRGESLAKILAYGEIKGCVLRQVVSPIGLSRKGVAEAGTVIQVRGSKRSPRKSDIAAKIERISLIVIEREEIGRGREICQPAGNRQFAFRDLIGVRKVDLSSVSDPGRTKRQFPTPDFGTVYSDGKTYSGADTTVIEEIVGVGLEVGDVENPSSIGDGDSELVLLVALPL
jgi:hypothetical protein